MPFVLGHANKVIIYLSSPLLLSYPKLAINIFDSIISSIIFYNSEVWRGYLNSDFKKWDKSPVEKVQLRFCKIYLGVNSKACNVASRGKLGRLP